MAGKQAKTLTTGQTAKALQLVRRDRHAARNCVMILLSVKAGLRAGEIAKLTWLMLMTADGQIGESIELHDAAAKKGSGRSIPIHPELRKALLRLTRQQTPEGHVIRSERGGPLRPSSVVNWFRTLYRGLGFKGVLVAFRSTHLHHTCSPFGVSCWRFAA